MQCTYTRIKFGRIKAMKLARDFCTSDAVS